MQIIELQTLKARYTTNENKTFEIVDGKINCNNRYNGCVLCPVYTAGHITQPIYDGVYNGYSVLFWNADE